MGNSGERRAGGRVVVNLGPADLRRGGGGFDLPIAVGILAAMGRIDAGAVGDTMFVGELSLDGSLRAVRGMLPLALAARRGGLRRGGVSAGEPPRAGGAPGGDDALAMSISKLTRWDIQWAYLISDLVVLALSATYIDLSRLGCSLLTVILSGQIIGLVQRVGRREDAPVKAEAAVEEQL